MVQSADELAPEASICLRFDRLVACFRGGLQYAESSRRLEPSRVRDVQTCSPRFGRPGTGLAAAGLHFGLRASVLAPQYENRAPVRASTPQVGCYTFPTRERLYFKKRSPSIRRVGGQQATGGGALRLIHGYLFLKI